MSAEGRAHYSVGRWNCRFPWIGTHLFVRDNPFDLNDRAIGRPIHKEIYPSRPTVMLHVAIGVGGCCMQDCHIRFDGGYCEESLALDWILKNLKFRVGLRQRSAVTATPRHERQHLRRRLESGA